MALQPKIIACGKSVAAFSMAVRFLTGPAVIAATSIGIGLRGVLLHVAIVQVKWNSLYLSINQSLLLLLFLVVYDTTLIYCRLHFPKVSFPLCSPKNTISMQIYLVLRKCLFFFFSFLHLYIYAPNHIYALWLCEFKASN